MTGGPIDQATVSLRIFGDTLDPDALTHALGCLPSEAARKGDRFRRRPDRIIPKGFWRLESATEQTQDLEGQIARLLDTLTDDLAIWQQVTQDYAVDLFCGVFLHGWNRGFSLSPNLLQRISLRNIAIDFDIYGPMDRWEGVFDEDEPSSPR